MSTTRKKNNIFKVILSGVTAAAIIAASAGCGTVDLTMGKNNKNSSKRNSRKIKTISRDKVNPRHRLTTA